MNNGLNITRLPKLAGVTERVVKYDPYIDGVRRYLTDFPTPDKFARILKDVDLGDVAALVELNEEMEAKDAHIQAVARKRRGALLGLDWEIEPDKEAEDVAFAQELADWVGEELARVGSFDSVLQHMASAIGPNVSVTEILWRNDATLKGFVPVPGNRLLSHTEFGSQVFVQLHMGDWRGMPAYPGKFMTHHPESRGGFPLRATITHAAAFLYLVKQFTRADWMAFSEVYGSPWRVAKGGNMTLQKDRDEVLAMLRDVGSDGVGVLPDNMDIAFLQANGHGETYREQMSWADAKLSILYLGETLTTELAGSTGSRAAAQVHDNVRLDVLVADIERESTSLRNQLFRHMVKLKYPDAEKPPIPYFVRQLPSRVDIEGRKLAIEQLRLAQEYGIPIRTSEVYELLGLTRPDDDGLPETITPKNPEPNAIGATNEIES